MAYCPLALLLQFHSLFSSTMSVHSLMYMAIPLLLYVWMQHKENMCYVMKALAFVYPYDQAIHFFANTREPYRTSYIHVAQGKNYTATVPISVCMYTYVCIHMYV